MKAIMLAALVVLTVSVLAAPGMSDDREVFPQQMTARQLLDACASSALTRTGRERRKYCAGFVSGVEEAVRVLKARHRLDASVCLADDLSARALTDVFVRHAASRQRELDRPAALSVLEALEAVYPCETGSQ